VPSITSTENHNLEKVGKVSAVSARGFQRILELNADSGVGPKLGIAVGSKLTRFFCVDEEHLLE
jgi:hypothetical protein